MDSPAGSAGAEQQHKENEQHNENEGQLLEMQPAKPGQLAATAQATPMAAAAAAADCSELQQPANGISAPSAPGRNAQADGGVAGAAPAAPREQSVIDLVGPPTARQPAAARAANALASALAPAQVQPGEVIDLLSDSDSEGPGRQAAMQPLKEACSATSPPAAALRASSSSSSVIDLLSDEEGDERASQPQQQVQRSEPLSKLEDEGARQQQPSQQQQQQQPLEERQEMRGSTHRQLSMQQPAVKSEPGVSEPAAAAAPAKPAAAAAAQVQPPVVAAAAAAQVQLPVVAAAAVSIKLEQQGLTQQQQQQAAPADQPHPVPPIAAAAAAAEEPQGSGSTQPADASGSQPGSSAGVPGPVGSSQRSHGTPSKRAGAEPEAQPPTKVWRVQEAVEQAAEERLQQQQKQAADSAGMPATAGYGEASAAERSHADSHISDLGTSRPAAGSPPASGKPAADDNAQQEQQQSQWQPAADVAAEAEADAEAAAAVQATAAALLTACEQQVAAAAAAGSPAAAAAAVAAAGGGEEEPMPDPSDAGAMLRWLRARIPAQLLETYREPHSVSVAEAEKTAERLQLYEEKMKRIRENNPAQRKHDLVAAKKVEEAYPRWGLWGTDPGHKAGIAVGQRFSGRGPLKALGIHTTYFTGIQTGGPNGVALAICLSGGYEDDDDHGDWFWYTGEGGRNDKTNTQVKDQAWVRGNAALRNAQLNGTPVRVVRAAARNGDPKQGFDYTYDGLYVIIRAGMEPSQSGPLVCRFLLVGLPGHYKANKSVSWVELRGFRNNLRLAAQASSEGDEEEEEGEEVEAPARRTKRARTQKAAAPSSAAAAAAAGAPRRHKKPKAAASPLPRGLRPVVQDGAWLRAQQARPGFLCADISEGAEVRKIPAFNDVDDEPLPELQYVRTSIVGTDAAQSLLDEGRSVMPSTWCGRELGRKKGHYNEHGLLLYTRGQGAWECGSACNSTACNHNRAVSTLGLRLPLEVFRTRGKGWGLRCAEDIPSGAFVCSYEGELLSSREAEERRGADFYLFDLDHFVIMHADCSVKERVRQALPGLPFEAREDSDHLVIDAHKIGNLARFLNHSCSPNLMKQPVLIPGDSGLRYRMCFFAYGDIKKGTELVYDYSYEIGTVPGLQIPCHCGARNCKGRLL